MGWDPLTRTRATAIGVTAAIVLLVAPHAAAAIPSADLPLFHPVVHSVSHSSSTNWAGYAVTGSKGSVSKVRGSWIVPKIQGTCPSAKYQYSSFWVGIDGYNSRSVEQTGTDSDCQGGSAVYYAWYEFYPAASNLISSLTVSPGDTISAQVSFSSGIFTVSLTDVTTSKTFSTTKKMTAARTSAEWIAEAPSGSSGILPLADFGTVDFGTDSTNVSSTCYATVSGTSAAMGSFSALHSITMVTQSGTATKAAPSAVSSDKTSFSVTWKSAGP